MGNIQITMVNRTHVYSRFSIENFVAKFHSQTLDPALNDGELGDLRLETQNSWNGRESTHT